MDERRTFGPFVLLPRRRELWHRDTLVQVGSRALDILILISERPGEVVGREEILARVWPGLHVEESNLRVHIAGLRKALGEAEGTSRYIATIPNRGYSFVVPVERHAETTQSGTHGLPRRLTTVIGRDACIATLVAEVAKHRFVTIVGSGGIGKSTVAVAVATRAVGRFPDGVGFVDFSGIANAGLVAASLASALGVKTSFGDPMAALLGFLRQRRMLIVLDCCEPAAESLAVLVEAVLTEAPGIRVLATSREPLRGDGERLFRLPPLGLPARGTAPAMQDVIDYPAIRLFIERATAADQTFAVTDANIGLIIGICHHLDGIPLAIELAAARVPQMALRDLHDRLDGRFSLLIRGRRTALPRHQTLRATLDWSFGLLSPEEQRLAMRMAIFRGDFTIEAAESVAAFDGAEDASSIAEGLARLVDKSLISIGHEGAGAFYRLLDVTRAYLHEKLSSSGDLNAISAAHACYFVQSLDAYLGRGPVPAYDEIRQGYGRFVDNVRAALAWAFEPGGSADLGIALTLAAVPLWFALTLIDEMRTQLESAIAVAASMQNVTPDVHMRLHGALAALATHTAGTIAAIETNWQRTLELAEICGDRAHLLRSLSGLMAVATRRDCRAALAWAERYRTAVAGADDPRDRAVGDRLAGWALHLLGEHQKAIPLVQASLDQTALTPDRDQPARRNFDERVMAMGMLARLLFMTGWPRRGMDVANETVREARIVGHIPSLIFAVMFCAGPLALLSGDLDLIEGGKEGLMHDLPRHSTWNGWSRTFIAIDQMLHGETGLAPELHASLSDMPPESFSAQFPLFHAALARAYLADGKGPAALAAIEAALSDVRARHEYWFEPELLRVRARILAASGANQKAAETLHAALSQARMQGAVCWELRIAHDLAGLANVGNTASALVRTALAKVRDSGAALYLGDDHYVDAERVAPAAG